MKLLTDSMTITTVDQLEKSVKRIGKYNGMERLPSK